jgi:mRNA interferase RelE/StbE
LTYRIQFKRSVSRDLRKLDKADADWILSKIETELPDRADALPDLKGKFTGLKRFRIGSYRVIFTVVDDVILITRIGHRKNVYRD